MPETFAGLPFSGAIDVSRHASYKGAEAAKDRALPQLVLYLALLHGRWPDGFTDAEAADRLGIERSSINARRAPLVRAGIVESFGSRPGNYALDNVVWRFRVPAEREGTQ